MSATDSIKNALEKAGFGVTYLRSSGNVSGEYMDAEPNAQITKPFIREFFQEVMLSYDTVANVGEVIRNDVTNDCFLLMNKTASILKNDVIFFDGVLYKCNVSGELFRPSGEAGWDSSYRKTTSWETIESDCYALQTEPLHGIELGVDEELANIGIENHELYIPSSIGIQQLDRYQPMSGEYYKVNSVKKRRFPGVDVALLEEDTRS